jgi:hypothetical protein
MSRPGGARTEGRGHLIPGTTRTAGTVSDKASGKVPAMMTRPVTITLPIEYIDAARRIATEEGTTVSGLTARALRVEVLRRDLRRLAAAGYAGPDADVADEHDRARSDVA